MLKEKIQSEFIAARKARNEVKRTILSVLVGEIQSQEALKGPITDKEVESKIRKLVVCNKETIAANSNSEKAIVLDEEIKILESFLPKYLSVSQIKIAFQEILEQLKSEPEGKAMGLAMKFFKEKNLSVLGDDVKQAIKELK